MIHAPKEFIETTNRPADSVTPFLFLVDFEMGKHFVCETGKAKDHGFWYKIN